MSADLLPLTIQCAIPQNPAREGAVYYCNVEPIQLKWVTRVPLVIVADKAGTMEPLRAFGMVAVRVVDAGRFVAYMVGERELASAEDIHTWVQTQFTRALWFELDELSPVLDLDAAVSDVVPGMQARLVRTFEGTGLDVGEVSIVMLKWWKTLGLAQYADRNGLSKDYVIELIRRGELRIAVP